MNFEDLFSGKKIIACENETTGLSYHGSFRDYGYYPARPFVFSFTTYENKNYYVRFEVDPFTRRVMYEKNIEGYNKLIKFFAEKDNTLIFHNANFDVSVISRCGISINSNIRDSMIYAHIDDVSKPTALKPLCKLLFDISDEDQEDLIKSVNKQRKIGKKLGWCIAT